MRIFRLIDMLLQTLIMIWVMIIVAKLFSEDWDIGNLLVIQFITGAWQIASAFVWLIFSENQRNFRRIHIYSSLIYLLFFMALPAFSGPESVTVFLMIAPPWSLAVFYYYITARTVFRRPVKGTGFLPHLSF